jgi:NADH dehydrogenase [ubiquinone] 1 alpha subcomplex assembly factor 6
MRGAAPRLSPVGAIARRHDRDRFLAALFAPAERREDLFALYAFNFEVAKTREIVNEPMLGQIRLQWWREAVDEIYAGGRVRAHEVVQPLAETVRRRALSREHLDRMIDARERDLRDEPPATLAALEAYCEDTAGRLGWLALEALGVDDERARRATREIGLAWALTGLIRAIPHHARARRRYIPEDVAASAGLGAEEVFALKPSPALARAAAAMGEAALAHLGEARHLGAPRAALPVLLPARLAGHYLKRLMRAGWDVFSPSVAMPDALKTLRLSAAAMTARY